jgi:signal transduction histidine kinase
VRTHFSKPKIADLGNILMFDKDVRSDLQNQRQQHAQSQLMETDGMSEIGRMACWISHDMRHSLTAIYANAEFLERQDISADVRAELLLEIQEGVLAMTERIDSLLHFANSGRSDPLVPPAEADIDARNLESAIYNLLLNACQAAKRSTHVPRVEVDLTEVDEQIYVTILDNGPGIPAPVRGTLFDPFVTVGKPNGTGLGLTVARRIAEEHGGSVRIEESNGERTVFTLSLRKSRLLALEGPDRCTDPSPQRGLPWSGDRTTCS